MRKILSIIFVLCFVLMGCQKTPSDIVVINKNEGILEEKIYQEAAEESSFNLPENINEQIYLKDGQYAITINADVVRLEKTLYPVVTVIPNNFTQMDVDTVINYFFGNSSLYAENFIMTKEMIQEKIVKISAEMSTMTGDNPDDIATAEAAILQLKQQYTNAPETVEKITGDSKLTFDEEMDCEVMKVYADIGYNLSSSISVNNQNASQDMRIYLDRERGFLSSISLTGNIAEGQQMTLKEAEDYANNTLMELGFTNLLPIKTEIGMSENREKQGYIVTFRQSVDGIPVALNTILDYSEDTSDYAKKWPSDRIKITLDDEGISAIIWNYKGEIQKELTSNVELLTFEEIYDITKQQLKNKFAWIEGDKISKDYFQTIHVDRIELEYVCIKQKDKEGSYLFIPAWNFYGGIQLKDENGKTAERHNGRTDICILSLNAIDGSVIRN